MEPRKRKTSTSTIHLGEDGIVRAVIDEGAAESGKHARENIAVVAEVLAGKRAPVLVDFRRIRSSDREARIFYASEDTGRVVSAVALLIGSPLSRVIGNFFMGLNKTCYPLRLFTAEAEALDWLKGYLG